VAVILDMESLTLTHMLILACAALVIGLIAGAVWPRWWLLNALLVGALFPAWTLASALFQIYRNPGSNNLFPVAVAIACVITLPPAFLGAGAGELIGRRWRAGPGP
jgi:hypothetical protein